MRQKGFGCKALMHTFSQLSPCLAKKSIIRLVGSEKKNQICKDKQGQNIDLT
jgi:hypothetical protein